MAWVAKSTAARAWLKGVAIAALSVALLATGARAETIGGALAKAYLNNPDINQQRAAVRVQDENVPKANAGNLPNVSAETDAAVSNTLASGLGAGYPSPLDISSRPRGYGVTVTQNVWNGDRVGNSVRQAESAVFGAREQLRNTEQNVLLSAVTYYMDVMRDSAILGLDRNNVEVLQEQLRQTQDRFNVGEVTRTDVAQAEASLAGANATLLSDQATLEGSIATYRRYIGDEPKTLAPVKPLVKPLPRTLPEAITISQVEHPAIVAAEHNVDVALLSIKVAEGALYPQASVSAQVTQAYDVSNTPGMRQFNAEILGQLTIPIYQGGAEYAGIRQSKEGLSVKELTASSERDQIRQNVVAQWGNNQAAIGVVKAARASVAANEVALAGVREEAKVGQRTTLDVLNAQQALLSARTQLVRAEHDQVVYSYALLSAIGRLNVPTLGLAVAEYEPSVHFNQLKN